MTRIALRSREIIKRPLLVCLAPSARSDGTRSTKGMSISSCVPVFHPCSLQRRLAGAAMDQARPQFHREAIDPDHPPARRNPREGEHREAENDHGICVPDR